MKIAARSLFCIMLCVSASVFAQASGKRDFLFGFGVQSQLRWQENQSQQLVSSPLVEAGLHGDRWGVSIELSRSEQRSGEGSVRMKSSSETALIWGNYEFAAYGMQPYAGLGLGWQREKVNLGFYDSDQDYVGRNELKTAARVGSRWSFHPHAWISGEGRLSQAPSQQNEAEWGFALKVGFIL